MSKKDVKKTPQAKSEITSPPSQPVQQPELKIEENTILATGLEAVSYTHLRAHET